MDSLEKWVSLSDICDHLNLSRDTVKKMVKQQNMPGYKVDRQWRFKISVVDAWIRSNGVQNDRKAEGQIHAKNDGFIRRRWRP